MIDLTSCFSEHAVKVSETSCSGGGSSTGGCGSSFAQDGRQLQLQSSITCTYRSRLSNYKVVLIRVTWSKSHTGPALSVGVDDDPVGHQWKPLAGHSQLFRKKKGSKSFLSGNSVILLYWDISIAKYNDQGPEPVGDFYVVVVVDKEFGLLLGELSKEYIKKFENMVPIADFSMFYRREQIIGQGQVNLYSTKARFQENGNDHEIMIRCEGDGSDAKESELTVCIDRKKVIHVRRLKWNFRGNQTIFIDGSPVDLMWDVHDWWFCDPSGCAMFMFRTRSALGNRLWLEEEVLLREKGDSGFTLLIQAFKGA